MILGQFDRRTLEVGSADLPVGIPETDAFPVDGTPVAAFGFHWLTGFDAFDEQIFLGGCQRAFFRWCENEPNQIAEHRIRQSTEALGHETLFEGGTDGHDDFLVNGVVVDVADEGVAVGVGGIDAALLNLHAGIGGAEVFMLHDAGQQLIRIRILGRAALAYVDAAEGHVKEVVDDAGADEEITRRVVIAAPWIAGAVGEDFELPSGYFFV